MNKNNIVINERKLNEKEIGELKRVVDDIYGSDIEDFTRRNYNLFINNLIFEPRNESTGNKCDDFFYLGVYYGIGTENHGPPKNYDLMKRFYMISVDKGNVIAMNNLGYHYLYIEKNHYLAEKYWLMAINKGYSVAMYHLGNYYYKFEKKYDLAKKYYLMASNKGNVDAMFDLIEYFIKIEKNYDLAEKYFLMAIKGGNKFVVERFAHYFDITEQILGIAKKCYFVAIGKGENKILLKLKTYYKHNILYKDDLYYILLAIIKGRYNFKQVWLFKSKYCNIDFIGDIKKIYNSLINNNKIIYYQLDILYNKILESIIKMNTKIIIM
jgi:hypothetical protein